MDNFDIRVLWGRSSYVSLTKLEEACSSPCLLKMVCLSYSQNMMQFHSILMMINFRFLFMHFYTSSKSEKLNKIFQRMDSERLLSCKRKPIYLRWAQYNDIKLNYNSKVIWNNKIHQNHEYLLIILYWSLKFIKFSKVATIIVENVM